ncbi:hypothetical protein ASPVEDRAFT_37280 [Aspergillus versicolor CBS 583.65]|uniref:Uncharacterized protein n=1 Tax=Aspergillus versicolor CBS 583.65 TaxID=1036611 RepID=A0A1L9P8H5_ASPVE|nr:uncharacterized protein ASPVEDRAFT_37280 [Aspergillus versicolor CBS 583.65]OJI97840.1 hypothetical protein ASPVEDRAFT_37280 [Aspergillus versicolor CBS 583.65]
MDIESLNSNPPSIFLSFRGMLLGAWNGLDASAECAEIWNSSWKPWFDKRKTRCFVDFGC